jgi:drug/metabolite transporter (DMT)-like permease
MSNWIARALTAITVVLWSMSYIWGKAVIAWADPFTAAVIRYTLSSALLLAVALPRGGMIEAVKGNWRAFLALGAIGIAGNQALIFAALNYTTSVNAAVIMALTPILTMAGAAMFLSEPFGMRARIGAVISLAGALLAVLGDGPKGLCGLTLDRGEPLALLGALCLAFYTVGSRRLLPSSLPVLTGTTAVICIGTLVLLPLAFFEPLPHGPPSADVLIAIAGLAIGGTVFGFLCWMYASRVLGVSEPSIYYNLIPVITMGLAALQGTPPWPAQIVGGLLVVAGVMLSFHRGRPSVAFATNPRRAPARLSGKP